MHRTRPKATLTREGEVLFRALAGSFEQTRVAVEQVKRRPDLNVVTVNTTIGAGRIAMSAN